MANDFIDYNSLGQHPYVNEEIASDIEKGYWADSLFDFYTGSGADRVIRQYKITDLSPFTARLKGKSYGDGVTGNANIADNLDEMDWYARTLSPEVIANGFQSEIDIYSTTKNIDFVKECKENLIQWFAERSDRFIIANLTNNLTNVVCASAAAANGIHPYVAGNSVKDMCAKVSKGDVCSVESIRRLIFCAKNGIGLDGKESFVVKPTRVQVRTIGDAQFISKVYLLFIDSYQAEQLKSDPEWKQMQAVNHNQGLEHSFFTGFLGKIDNCWIVELPTWSKEQAGLLHSEVDNNQFAKYVNKDAELVSVNDYHGNNQATSIGFLLGASACIYANNGNIRLLTQKADMNRKTLVAADKIIGVRKAVFDAIKSGGNHNSIYHGKDFGVIGYITSKE